MLTDLSLEEKRELLRLSRIKLGIDTKIPREKATDAIVERGIFGCSLDKPCSEDAINQAIASLGLMKGLRREELKASLSRLCADYKIQRINNEFQLNKDRIAELEFEIKESNKRFDTIVNRVYSTIMTAKRKTTISRFFLDFISLVFAQFGEQWIKSLCNQATSKDFLKESDIENIFNKLAKKHCLPKTDRDRIKKISVKFLEENDVEYDMLKFNLAQSFYITKILGVDTPVDLFSQKIFANATMYLDTNIVFASLLPVSRHNITFKELLTICKKTGIELSVTNITKNEVERVVSHFEADAINVFDEIPEKITPKVRGTFFESYVEEKKKNPRFSVTELFKPFHEIKETLQKNFAIDVVDSAEYDTLFQKAEKDSKLQTMFNAKSLEARKRAKGKESLFHDIFHYFLVENTRKAKTEKSWFLTLDTSLPYVAAELQKEDESPFCFKLDVLMQCFSLFVTEEKELQGFSEVFSKLVSNQLFPTSKLFDARDFLLFVDIGVKIKDLSEDDVENALYHIKKHVLKGKTYTHDDLEKVTYELKKIFMARADKDDAIKRQLEKIEELERKHKAELSIKDKEILEMKDRIKHEEETRNADKIKKDKIIWYIKIVCFCIAVLSILYILFFLSTIYAEGKNIFKKVLDFWPYYLGLCAGASLCFRCVEKNDAYRKALKKQNK